MDSGVSIHLMLLFIGMREILFKAKRMFQYISCYSLSGEMYGLNSSQSSFNTSHVTLYRKNMIKYKRNIMFQYISCYSLSCPVPILPWLLTAFQYISCYSLSDNCVAAPVYDSFVSIHLMLLFIQL